MRVSLPMRTSVAKLLLPLLLMAAPACAHTQDAASPYRDLRTVPEGTIVHLRTGLDVDWPTLIDHLSRVPVVYVGEVHDNPDAHRVQAQVLRALAERHPDLAVGLEMIPRDHQPLLDDWIADRLPEKEFARLWTELWQVGYLPYRDLLTFARERHIPLLALNAPRALVKAVSREGLDKLPEEMRAELPREMDSDDPYHRAKTEAIFGGHAKEHGMDVDRFYPAQVLWDETMAETAADYLSRHPGAHLLILAGGFHVEQAVGIPRRLFRRVPVPFLTLLPYNPVTPKDKEDQLMDVDMPPIPLLLADFAWAVPYGDLPGVKLGVLVDASDGVRVTRVLDDTPAARAGLLAEDQIQAINGEPIRAMFDLQWALGRLSAGDTTTVTIQRGDQTQQVRVTF